MTARSSILMILLVAFASVVSAVPASNPADTSRTSALSQVKVHSLKPYTFYAATAYCSPESTIDWSCGQNCAANPDFVPVASGGDGSLIQFCACM